MALSVKKELRHLLDVDVTLFLLLAVTISLLSKLILDNYILTDEVFASLFRDQLSGNQLLELMNLKSKYLWVSYSLVPVGLFLKIFLISVCVTIGLIFLEEEVRFLKILKVFAIAEAFICLYHLVETGVLFQLAASFQTLEDYTSFQLLSLYALFGDGIKSEWLVFILKEIDLALFIHAIIAVILLSSTLKKSRKETTDLLLATYGMGWLLYVVVASVILAVAY